MDAEADTWKPGLVAVNRGGQWPGAVVLLRYASIIPALVPFLRGSRKRSTLHFGSHVYPVGGLEALPKPLFTAGFVVGQILRFLATL